MNSKSTQMQIWETIINKISNLIINEGKEPVVINVEARQDPNEHYRCFMTSCNYVKNQYEAIVTTGLPNEERIFWVNQDAQFYIDDKGHVKSTGNLEVIKRIVSA